MYRVNLSKVTLGYAKLRSYKKVSQFKKQKIKK
jgi:hypothetical protein